MKVVFLQDVPHVAQAGEVKEVADGYGRNFLIPKKLAALAHPQVTSQIKTKDSIKAQMKTELIELAHQLEGKELSLKAKAGAKDRLYGSITSADIAAELKNTGLDIDKRKIELDEPIRQLGSYEIAIRLARDIIPKIKVTVAEEEALKEEEKPPKKEKKVTKAKEKAPKKKTAKKEEKTEKEEKAPKKKTTKAEKKATKKKPTKKAEKTTKEEKT
jgi:large subunit ribosomal protein L9